jgi:dihydrofolate reductase
MRPLILKMDITLDGFVGAADGDVQWAIDDFGDPALQEWMLAGLWDAGTHLMGRAAYDEMSPHWPAATDVFAPPMNEIPKVVFSSTVTDPEWADTRVLSGDLATEIAALKAEDGKPILLHGGASFARSLSALGLIDEYRLLVHPIALGEGLPLFGARTRLRLTSARTFATGIVASTFVPG